MISRKWWLVITILWLVPVTASAQYFDADLNLLLGIPEGEFRDNLDREAVGLNGSFGVQLPESPLQFGVELGIMTYGSDRRRENFSPNIPEVSVVVRTDYDIFTGHLFGRFERPVGLVRPYVDGLIGLKYLFTESRVRDDNFQGEDIASTVNFDDTTFSYGLGGGLKFLVYEQGFHQYLINLKARYLRGGQARYLQPGSIEVVNGSLRFDESRSNTNLITVHLGVAFKF